MKILQWNINSALGNKHNLIILVNELNPDVIILNETRLKQNMNFNLPGYNIVHYDRIDGHGGIATLIRKSIKYEVVQFQSPNMNPKLQILIIKIVCISIINIYNPPNNKIDAELISGILSQTQGSVVLMGDMNAHHTAWGSAQNNLNGNIIMTIIDNFNLYIANDGTDTRLRPPLNNPSPLDLTLLSAELAPHSTWEVTTDCGNSDHFPTLCTLHQDIITKDSYRFTKRIFKKADWDLYSITIDNFLQEDEDISYDNLMHIINHAAEITIPTKTASSTSKPKNPWWDQDCDKLLQERKKSLKVFKTQPSLDNFLSAKRIIANIRRRLKEKKKISFRNFCENLNRNTDSTLVWNTIKKFSHNHVTRKLNLPNQHIAKKILDKLTVCDIRV